MVREISTVFSDASHCRACRDMGCRAVLGRANGRSSARVLFVGEAPGRFGAGITGVPFSGDVAGARFERLLGAARLDRSDVFITNAVLCLPLDAKGRNRTPRASEVRNCSAFLSDTIAAISPELVVAMGSVALDAVRRIEPVTLELKEAGRDPLSWNGRQLAVVYHPGARSQVFRGWDQQIEDWVHLGKWIVEAGLNARTLRA